MPWARRVMLKVLLLAAAAALCVLLLSTALPWLAERGWAGRAVREAYRQGRDASGLFYTDSERTREILRQLRKPSHHPKSLEQPSPR